jgi:flavin reductase (DIM6/NTAB) family NADH-FMN oxidoreductase RutF
MHLAADDLARRRLRDALAHVPTGVVIATTMTADGTKLGMTMNSFTSVSLDPPLVLFCIDRRALSLPAWQRVPGYAVNVLASRQGELSNRFARPSPAKWAGVASTMGLHGAPLLQGAIAHFECTAQERVDGGDHVIFIGRIERHRADADSPPLVFHRGRYAEVADPLTTTPAAQLANWPLPIHY